MQCPTHYQFGWRPDRSIGRSTWDGIWWGRSDPFASRRILVHRSCQQILQQHDGENLVKKSGGRKQEFEGGKSCQIIALSNVIRFWVIYLNSRTLLENQIIWWEIGLFWRVFLPSWAASMTSIASLSSSASSMSSSSPAASDPSPCVERIESKMSQENLGATNPLIWLYGAFLAWTVMERRPSPSADNSASPITVVKSTVVSAWIRDSISSMYVWMYNVNKIHTYSWVPNTRAGNLFLFGTFSHLHLNFT